MAQNNTISEASRLSEELLDELEMGRSTLTLIAMKASRLARLIGDSDTHEILMYEANGYTAVNGVRSPEVWRLGRIAGRTYQAKGDDGVEKTFGKFDSIEQLEVDIAALKARSPKLEGINLRGNNQALREKLDQLTQRRLFIHKFVSATYFELKFSALAGDVFERTRAKVDKNVGAAIPQAVKKFTAVYENLLSKNDEDWSNAVHSCRRILQDAADALYPSRPDKIINVRGKDKTIKLGPDNYINRLMAYVEENASSSRFEEIVGSHIGFLGERLDSIFKAAQKGSHDVITTQEEADRYVIYTYLVIGDILDLKAEVDATASKASD